MEEIHSSLSELIETAQRFLKAIDNDTRAITCGEAAFLLNKTPQTISRYIAEGKIRRASANGVNGVRAKDVYMLMLK